MNIRCIQTVYSMNKMHKRLYLYIKDCLYAYLCTHYMEYLKQIVYKYTAYTYNTTMTKRDLDFTAFYTGRGGAKIQSENFVPDTTI